MIIQLENIDPEAVYNDIRKVAPNFEAELPRGISIIKLPPRVIEAGTYDENGEEITPPIYGEETRYDINIHPNHIPVELPVFATEVTPEVPEHKIYRKKKV